MPKPRGLEQQASMHPLRLLFVCSQNRLRSPTADKFSLTDLALRRPRPERIAAPTTRSLPNLSTGPKSSSSSEISRWILLPSR
jgi:hypothetical protein